MAANDKTGFVIDSSALYAILAPDEKPSHELQNIFLDFSKQKLNLYAPELLKYEITNILKSSILRKRVSAKQAQIFLKKFLEQKIYYQVIDFNKALEISIEENISAYDACYLYLSQTLNLPLLTLDTKLQKLLN